MQLSLMIWSVWGVLVISLVVMKIYIMGLSRDENDELVLQDSGSRVKAEQDVIMARLQKVQPIQKGILWALGAMTLVVVVYYVIDMIRQFQ